MYQEVFMCDRKSCNESTKALAPIPGSPNGLKFPFENENWIRRNTIETGVIIERDFCSLECEAVWCDQQLKKKEGGK